MADIVEHCWLLDLDRTLSSVEVVMGVVEHVCKEMGLDYDKISEQKKVAESHGHSFSAVTTIRSLWPERVVEFFGKFKKIEHINSIYPDAKQFISKLKEQKTPFLVITYGDTVWQEAKLHLLGLWSEPFIICDIPEKSVLLRQYKKDEIFELHTESLVIAAKTVTLVDDKLEAFVEMPEGARSIFMNRSRKESVVPEGILEVNSFAEILGEIS